MSIDDILAIEVRPAPLLSPVHAEFRIGIVGLGRFVTNSVLPSYRQYGLNVVAAADPDPVARERARVRFGIERLYENYDQLLESEELDVLDINLRWDRGMSDQRVDAVAKAAARGVNVLMAKPMAATLAQCEAIVASAKAAGVRLAINQNSRFGPAMHACRRYIEEGAIGPVVSAAIAWNAARGVQHDPGFDAFHDVTVHQTDILLSWFDRLPETVFADQSRISQHGSVVNAIMRFDDGSSGSIRDDFVTDHLRRWDFSVAGETGSIDGVEDIEIPEVGQPRMQRSSIRVASHERPGVFTEIPLPYRYTPEAYYLTMADLLSSIADDREPWASGENVLRTMRTLIAMEQSCATGAPVRPADLRP